MLGLKKISNMAEVELMRYHRSFYKRCRIKNVIENIRLQGQVRAAEASWIVVKKK